MGRFGKRKRTNNDAPKKDTRGWTHYDDIPKENEAFETYYKAMGVVPEGEWEQFLEALKRALPATFRVTGHRFDAAVLRKKLLDGSLLRDIKAVDAEASNAMLTELPWYKPEGTAWQIDAGRKQVRTDEAYKALHGWLVAATEHGDISRQEAVSMVPPLVLDVRADHTVLDMCAAPGSKTAQLIEAMHVDAEAVRGGGAVPRGVVVANDADRNRSYMLHHQVSRVLSPCLVVTNMDASSFPKVETRDGALLFDRVLADVPCSGDGTLRKNAKIWREWTANIAMGLHALQVRILRRGLELLRVGGRLVYSTCSLNPIEDEAVVAAVLAEFDGAVRIVDVSDALPQLKRCAGISTWPVMDRDGTVYATHDDVPVPRRRIVKPTFFPMDQYVEFGLDRCMRILPHLQDTGGFFVAVLEKVGAAEVQTVDDSAEDAIEVSAKATNGPQTHTGFTKEGDLVPVAFEDETATSIMEYYGVSKTALAELGYSLFTRVGQADSRMKTLTVASYATSSLVTSVAERGRVRLVNAGVRAFELYEPSKRQISQGITTSGPCEYRLLSESAALLLPLLTRRTAEVSAADARAMLNSQDSVELKDRTRSLEEILSAGPGGAVFYVRLSATLTPIAIPVWVMAGSRAKAFIPAANRPAMLMALGADQ